MRPHKEHSLSKHGAATESPCGHSGCRPLRRVQEAGVKEEPQEHVPGRGNGRSSSSLLQYRNSTSEKASALRCSSKWWTFRIFFLSFLLNNGFLKPMGTWGLYSSRKRIKWISILIRMLSCVTKIITLKNPTGLCAGTVFTMGNWRRNKIQLQPHFDLQVMRNVSGRS